MKYWKRINEFGDITTVESYSHNKDIRSFIDDEPLPDTIEIDEAEFNAYIAALPPIITTPPRDAIKELDALTTKLQIAGVIPLAK